MTTTQAPDMNQVMEALARSRPVFHSESDFKHALSWQVQLDHPAMRVRQEVGNLVEELDRRYVDIWFPDSGTAVELKYRTTPAAIRLDDEYFNLKGQGATLIGRYDFWHDVARLEGAVLSGRAKQGYAILLTNDHLYWDPGRQNTFDSQFRTHEGREVTATLAWAPGTGSGTTRDRENPLTLRGTYRTHWREYSNPQGTGNIRFRYLLLHVSNRMADRRGGKEGAGGM
jgi:hypothetical protein